MSNNFKRAVDRTISVLTEGRGLQSDQHLNIREADASVQRLYYNAKTLESQTVLHDLQYIVIQSKSSPVKEIENYIVIYGFEYPEDKDAFFLDLLGHDLVQLEGPDSIWVYLFLLLEGKLNVKRGISIDYIDQNLLGRRQELEEEKIGYEDFEVVFEPICILKKGHSCRFASSERLIYYLTALSGKYQTIGLDKLQSKYKDAFLNAADSLTFDNFFIAMTASHWKHVVIELYRSLENLFSIPLVIEFKRSLGYSEPARELVKLCVDKLRWKRNERHSLFCLLSQWGKDKIMASEVMTVSVFTSLSTESENFVENFTDALYQIRNQFVHQLECYQEKDIPPEELEILALFLIDINIDLYSFFDSELGRG